MLELLSPQSKLRLLAVLAGKAAEADLLLRLARVPSSLQVCMGLCWGSAQRARQGL